MRVCLYFSLLNISLIFSHYDLFNHLLLITQTQLLSWSVASASSPTSCPSARSFSIPKSATSSPMTRFCSLRFHSSPLLRWRDRVLLSLLCLFLRTLTLSLEKIESLDFVLQDYRRWFNCISSNISGHCWWLWDEVVDVKDKELNSIFWVEGQEMQTKVQSRLIRIWEVQKFFKGGRSRVSIAKVYTRPFLNNLFMWYFIFTVLRPLSSKGYFKHIFPWQSKFIYFNILSHVFELTEPVSPLAEEGLRFVTKPIWFD